LSLTGGAFSSQMIIEVDGAPLDPILGNMLIEAEVDTSLFLPDEFRLVFLAENADLLAAGALELGSLVSIQVDTSDLPVPLMVGEITAMDLDYGPEGLRVSVRGYDLSHRLMKGTATRAFPEAIASEAVAAILAESEVPPGEIIPTETFYFQLTQGNISDWAFIQQLAADEGYDAYMQNGFFHFKPPTLAEEGLPPVEDSEEPATGTQLVMGKNLIRLRASVSGGDAVGAVQVRGWDPVAGIPVIGEAPTVATTVLSEDPEADPAALGELLGGVQFTVTDRPYSNESMAEKRALSVATQLSGSSVEMYGECIGDPSIMPGQVVSLGMAGLPFDGMYVVSESRHNWAPGTSGYTTWFTVGGRRERSLLSMTSAGTGMAAARPSIPGVVVGTVVDADDPEELCRVKVFFPWLDNDYVSDFIPTVQLGVGAGWGSMFIPEVGTTVLVAFDKGDINAPYILGNVITADTIPVPPADVEGVVNERRIMSRMRHMIWFQDGEEAQGITIITGEEDCFIRIDAMEQGINIAAAAALTIDAADITITAEGSLTLTSAGVLTLEGEEVAINATSLNMAAEADASLTAEGDVAIVGAVVLLGE
jgi:hypothetical protein